MSDDQLAEQMNDEQLPDEVDQVEEQQEGLQTDGIPDDLTAVEQGQWEEGWRPENMFEGKPGNWKSAGEYKLYGEMQGDLRAAKAETRRVREEADQRFSNLNKYHEGKRQAEISDLKAQQRQAVEEADTALYDRLQTQIESTVVEPVQSTQPGKAPEISEWEARQGSWVNDPKDERTIQANTFYNIASGKPNATYESALEYVDKQLAKLYPDQQAQTNPRRESATMTEQSRQPRQRQRNNKELSMSDLTSQEAREYEMFGKDMFKDEKQFLKSVQDARKS
jgi:hypothetical protein